MMFLVDTNIWLELILNQEKANTVSDFLRKTETRLLSMTDFSLYSIGIILTRFKKDAVFEDFISDTIEDSGVGRIRLDTDDLKKVLSDIKRFKLDFDDAYQYVAAEKYNLTIINFDNDFDRTERVRKIPEEIQEIV